MVEKRKQRHPNTKDSPLRQWLLAADAVDRSNRRILFLALTTLLLLPALWFTVPPLLTQLHLSITLPLAHEKVSSALETAPSTATTSALPVRRFSIQLLLEQGQPETEQILEKIRQRPLHIQLKTIDESPGMLLLIDETPTTQRDAERLKNLYTQLFGVDGKIVKQ